jgi:hypothetical protein
MLAMACAAGCGSDGDDFRSGPVGSAGTGGESGIAGTGSTMGNGGGGGCGGDTGGGGGMAGAPVDCTPTNKADAPDEDFTDSNCDGIDGDASTAVFVSPDGFDDAAGTLGEPVLTLRRAVELASEDGRSIYACNGTYRENLTITTPLAIYGGYDCTQGWRRIKDWAVLESGTGVPLVIRGVDGLVHIERMAFRALDGVAAGQSSQAAAVVDSTNVEFARVEFMTGDGAPGQDGRAGTPGTDAPTTGARLNAKGADTSTTTCSSSAPSSLCNGYANGGNNSQAEHRCLTGTPHVTRGGGGGRGGNVYVALNRVSCIPNDSTDPGVDGTVGQILQDGQWQPVSAANLGRSGGNGDDGRSAMSGLGHHEGGVYLASNGGSDGSDGTHGYPGKGGYGGNSTGGGGDVCRPTFTTGSGGGQGGAGGCAGMHATAGGGGGGSIGLVLVNSTVTLMFPRFAIGDGGAGGDGASGGAGKEGSARGAAGAAFNASYSGQAGQAGGKGGDGGDGGAGAGGPSIAILYAGAAPTVSDGVYGIGLPGSGGLALSLGNAPPGVTGEIVSLNEMSQ